MLRATQGWQEPQEPQQEAGVLGAALELVEGH